MNAITIQELHKTYDGGVHAVQGIDLTIRRGEVYGLLGPNGAGKSTTIKMLTGLIKPSGGTIDIEGAQMPQDIEMLTGKIGYVPQELIFYNHLTVKENLKLFATAYEIANPKERIEELLDLLQIQAIANRRASDLSGGQKRRVNLAIGLLHQPEILILDEPSAGMDPQSRNILWESIRNVASSKGVTIILTTHLMETVDRLADRIGIIDNGKVIIEGTPLELKQKYGQGDVLLVKFKEYNGFDFTVLEPKLTALYAKATVSYQDYTLRLTMQNLMEVFSDIVSQVERITGKERIQSLTIHENTLEDVFIHLTGKELRE